MHRAFSSSSEMKPSSPEIENDGTSEKSGFGAFERSAGFASCIASGAGTGRPASENSSSEIRPSSTLMANEGISISLAPRAWLVFIGEMCISTYTIATNTKTPVQTKKLQQIHNTNGWLERGAGQWETCPQLPHAPYVSRSCSTLTRFRHAKSCGRLPAKSCCYLGFER